jgi:hypothetical protein
MAIHQGYSSIAAAEAALQYARAKGWTADSTPATGTPLLLSPSYEDNPLNAGASHLWYAVCRGVVPGVYRTYLECSLNTKGIRGNLCASFASREEAETAFAQAVQNEWVQAIARST